MDFPDARTITTGQFEWHDAQVVVTGGAGFVGSYLVEDLLAAGARVRVVDDLSSGTLANLSHVQNDIEFISLDLTDRESAAKAISGCNVVFHLAAKAFGMLYSMAHNFEALRDNVLMALNVLDGCRVHDVSRVLMVSSSCVYDDDAPIPTPELAVHLGRPESVNEGYGWGKRILEIQSRYAYEQFGIPISIVRPFNAYGGRYVWQGDASHVVPSLVKKVLDRNGPVVVWGSGKQVRDLLHARDFALGFRLAMESTVDCNPVNLAGGTTVRLDDLVMRIGELIGVEPEIRFDKEKAEGRARKEADLTELGLRIPQFRQTVSLTDGLLDMIEWYNRNSVAGAFGS